MKQAIVGIITILYDNYNYGGVLQAYALYNYLCRQGYDVTEILYDQSANIGIISRVTENLHSVISNPKKYIEHRKKSWEFHIRSDKYQAWSRDNYACDIQKKAFEDILKGFKSTAVYDSVTVMKCSDTFDFAITGGDQVFNPDWANDTWFLKTIKAKKKISYSASIAKAVLSNKDKKTLREGVAHLSAVSVRENSGKKQLEELGIQSDVVIDPVGLFSAEEWREVATPIDKLKEKEYVFAYILGEQKTEVEAVKRFADNHGLPLVMIPHVWRRFNEWDDELIDIKIPGITPEQFVWAIDNAKYVLTDSFHGTMFSIILKKQFYSFNRFKKNDKRSLNSRLTNVLEVYGLCDRMKSLKDIQQITEDSSIDFEYVNRKLSTCRNEGRRFLEKQLGDARHE